MYITSGGLCPAPGRPGCADSGKQAPSAHPLLLPWGFRPPPHLAFMQSGSLFCLDLYLCPVEVTSGQLARDGRVDFLGCHLVLELQIPKTLFLKSHWFMVCLQSLVSDRAYRTALWITFPTTRCFSLGVRLGCSYEERNCLGW